MQIISNGKLKSVEHRVLASSYEAPRIPVPVLFNPAYIADTYGPLPKIDETARYHDFEEAGDKSSIKKLQH